MKTKVSNSEERLGTEPMLRLFLKMSLPSLAAQLVNLLYTIVDRVFIGHIPNVGTDALAGVGVTMTIVILVAAFAVIVGIGGSSLASIELGKGDKEKAKRILGNGFSLLALFTLLLMGPCYLFMEPILLATGASAATLPYAIDYLSIYLIGTFSVLISTGLNSFISIQGRPNIAMVAVCIGAVLNIILDYIFIIPCGMGIKGAALATIISQTASAVFILRFLSLPTTSLRLELPSMKFDKKIILTTLALGISPFIMVSTDAAITLVINNTLKSFGDLHVSAVTVIQSALLIASITMNGFGQGLSPIVSYNFGARKVDRVKECFKISFTFISVINFVMVLFMILFPSTIASIFTTDAELIALVDKTMPIFLLGMLLFGMQRTCQSMFIALNEAKISIFIAILRKVILLIPLALLLPIKFGALGVYYAEAIADGTAAIVCVILFLARFKQVISTLQKLP